MTKYKVSVARFPGDGWEYKACVGWLIKTLRQMDKDERISDVHSICISDTPITMGRNRAVLEAKEAKSSYLLMLDSDMVPDLPGQQPFWETAWQFMVDRRQDEDEEWPSKTANPPATIAAPYCGPPPHECCYVFHWASKETGATSPNFRLEMISREHAAVSSGIQEVAALPTGLILYDMRVFDILPPPWYRYEYEDTTESRKATTEDVYQTRNASLLGLPQYVAWDCWAGHYKGKVVPKPHIVTRDEVHSSLVEAVKRGIDSGDRLIVQGSGDQHMPPIQAEAAFDPMEHEVPDEDLEGLRKLTIGIWSGDRQVAVEIGSWAGRSTLVLANRFDSVFAVDHWLGSDRLREIADRRGQEACFRTFCRNMGDRLFRTVFPLKGMSDLWAGVWDRPIDLLFIDGDHRYASVKDDIELWLPSVRNGGLIVCHDYGVFEGVTRAVEELLPDFQRAGRTLAWWEKS